MIVFLLVLIVLGVFVASEAGRTILKGTAWLGWMASRYALMYGVMILIVLGVLSLASHNPQLAFGAFICLIWWLSWGNYQRKANPKPVKGKDVHSSPHQKAYSHEEIRKARRNFQITSVIAIIMLTLCVYGYYKNPYTHGQTSTEAKPSMMTLPNGTLYYLHDDGLYYTTP